MFVENVVAYIGLGSNLGDRAANLLFAVRGLLEAHLCVQRLSAVYETEPVGVAAAHQAYLNMVAEVTIKNVTPEQMLARMLRIEYLLGRRRDSSEKAPRTVDLDLLLFGNLQHHTQFLTVPHPRLHRRNFVLVPLAEIAPTLIHPILKKSIRELLKSSADTARVHRFSALDSPNFEFQSASHL